MCTIADIPLGLNVKKRRSNDASPLSTMMTAYITVTQSVPLRILQVYFSAICSIVSLTRSLILTDPTPKMVV